jgi:TonB family protein
MSYLWKCIALIFLASSFTSAQSAGSATVQQNDGHEAHSPQPNSSSTTAATPQPTTGDSKILEIIHEQKADYPIAAERDRIQGEVVVKVQVSEMGDVEKTEVLSGDPILADSAVRAARKFKFKPFIRNGKAAKVTTKLPFDFYFRDKVIKTNTNSAPNAPSNSVQETSIGADVPKRVTVSAGVTAGLLIRAIAPVYPREARQNHVQGSVVLRAIIGKDGRIKDLKAISGPSELFAASIGAVQQWVYRPYLLMGEPVEVDTEIKVNFKISGF